MYRSRLFLAVLVSVLAVSGFAQQRTAQDSLEQQILARPATDTERLGKARAALLESLTSGDTAKARSVLRYMETRFDTNRITVLFSSERLLVSYWLRDFPEILLFARTVDPNEAEPVKITPQPDPLYDDMIQLSRKYEGTLRMDVRRSDLAPHERDFLLLLLSDMLGQERGDQLQRDVFQRRMNEESDVYLATYANSEYAPYVRNFIRFVFVRSDWGYGLGASIGYLALPDDLSRHLGDYVLISLNLEGTYRWLYGSLGLDIGLTHRITKGFEYNGTWYEGMKVMHASGLLAAGSMLELGGGFLAIPSLGISYMGFVEPDNDKSESGTDVKMGFAAWALNANFRIPLGGEDGTSFITINVGYRQAMTSIELAKGGYTFVNVGFGIFDRVMERDF